MEADPPVDRRLRRRQAQRRRRSARRALAGLGLVALLALVAGVAVGAGGGSGSGGGAAPGASAAAHRPAPAQLPGGGRSIFPQRRVVAFYGNPRSRALGTLGVGTPDQAARRLLKRARSYARASRPVLPALQLISTVADAAPGPQGLYRTHMPDAMIRRYLRAARRIHALLILDVQPGRSSFGPEIDRLAKWLRLPDVGLALDTEWHVGPGQVPGQVIGHADARELQAAAAYLSRVVKAHDLPEKLLVVHRFTQDELSDQSALRSLPGVQVVLNVDGFGSRQVKVAKYQGFVRETPGLRRGFKLFFQEDSGLMTPAQVMAMRPRPDLIAYE